MPRTTVETLNGYSIRIRKVDVPEVDPNDGQQIHDALGLPKLVPLTILTFLCPLTGHVIEVPLPDEGRHALIEALTGGIAVPNLVVQ